ncbi:MAG: hypothetical protein ACRDHN_16875, partial [Thermomicrobiales bacterium]
MSEPISRRSILKSALLLPAGLMLPSQAFAQESTPAPLVRGPKPIAIFVPKAEIDAPIEICEIISGQMSNPSGPWVVGWYRESGRLGEADNMVMAGHLD